MPGDWSVPRCPAYRPDHNGECLLCDEWADAHDAEALEAGADLARVLAAQRAYWRAAMPVRDYDSTVVRVTGNILAGWRPGGTAEEEDALVRWAVKKARAVVSEVKRTEREPS